MNNSPDENSMIPERWHVMIRDSEEAPETQISEFHIGGDSPWFAGHFPDEPILPGVALLAMVADGIRRFEGKRRESVRISGVKRVRFKMLVRPRDTVVIRISREKTGKTASYAFQARVKEEIVCTGVLLAELIGMGRECAPIKAGGN
jgi:3-hydroxyacyl-[acyl-carrier-protein] dehydratase